MSDWYYALNNEQKGPVNESEIKNQLAAQKLPADALVWKEGMDNWTPANKVPAFSFREPPAPATFAKLAPATAPVTERVESAAPGVHNPESVTPVTVASLVGPGEALEVDPEDAENHKIFGILAYLPFLWLVPLYGAKESPFAKYHANQGFVLFVLEMTLWIVLAIINHLLAFIPFLSFVSVILGLLWLGIVALLVFGVINAAAGKCVPLPLIGGFKLIK
jgi:uncharacterized membrane protein